MKIGVISSSVFTIPLSGYGGLEYIAYHQAKGLAARGHQVGLFAPDGSFCEGVENIPIGPAGISEMESYSKYWHLLPNCDAIIDNSWQKWAYCLKAEGKLQAPVLGVLHAPVNTMYQIVPPQFEGLPPVEKPCFVCISDDQRAHFEALFGRQARRAYNGCFDGSSLLTLEGGVKERIDNFVRRKGKERVLSWNEKTRRFTYVYAQKWLDLAPENDYAIELSIDGLESTLTSTPDNPIMTKEGWKEAGLISVEDEVLCGWNYLAEVEKVYELDRSREEICAKLLRKDENKRDRRGARSPRVVSVEHRDSLGIRKTPAIQGESIVDREGDGTTLGEFLRSSRSGDLQSATKTHVTLNQSDGYEERTKKEENGLLQENHFGGSKKYPFRSSSLFSRSLRWGGLRHNQSGKRKIQSDTSLRCGKFRSANHKLRKGVAASSELDGSSKEHKTGDNSSAALFSSEHNRPDCGRSAKEDNSIHDGKEEKSGKSCGVLQYSYESGVERRIHEEANRIVSSHQKSKLSTWKKVVGVKRVPTPKRVFDLKTSTGSFVANDIVVHNCDLEFYKPIDTPRSDRFLFLARFSEIKGADLAIEACLQAGVGLDMIGDTTITNEPAYFQKCMAMAEQQSPNWKGPGKQIRMIGNVGRGETVWWYSQAYCMLHPNMRFREPFGLAPVEAMACGCPVIAWNYGAMRETIYHCEKFENLVIAADVLVATINAAKTLGITNRDRERCRENASRFSVDAMCKGYEDLINEALSTGGW